MIAQYYAIRHKVSGDFMPMRMNSGAGRGWSYWEPSAEVPTKHPPRLFHTKRAAVLAMKAWVKGKWQIAGSSFAKDSLWDDDGGVYVYGPKDCGRKASDVEIVAVTLVEVQS